VNVDPNDVLEVARHVARNYKRRCWWVDVDDLTSEACLQIMLSARSFDPQVGVAFKGYAYRAAMRSLSYYVRRQSSPVSASDATLKDMVNARRAEVPIGLTDHRPSAAEQLDTVRWHLAARRQIRRVAAKTTNGDAAIRTILDGDKPAPAARATTSRAVHLIRRKLRDDAVMFELWQRTP